MYRFLGEGLVRSTKRDSLCSAPRHSTSPLTEAHMIAPLGNGGDMLWRCWAVSCVAPPFSFLGLLFIPHKKCFKTTQIVPIWYI